MTHPVDLQQEILVSLREIRTEQVAQGQEIAGMRSDIHSVIGNGQPGRLGIVESEVKNLREWQAHSKGWFAGLSAAAALLGAIGHWIVDSIRHK